MAILALACAELSPPRVPGPDAPPVLRPVPLAGVEPDLPAADLRALAGWLGDAPLVGLGERTHGTHELHRLAHRIFRYL